MTKKTDATGAKTIEAKIKTIAASGKKLEALAHETACDILQHVEDHGDITLAEKLVEALPSLARKNALKAWFLQFGKLNYNAEKKRFTYAKGKVTDIEGGKAQPFWDFRPEPEFKPYNLEKQLHALLKKAETRMQEGNEQDNIPSDLLEKVRAIVA